MGITKAISNFLDERLVFVLTEREVLAILLALPKDDEAVKALRLRLLSAIDAQDKS